MASTSRGDSGNPYDGGLGAGGKFRRRPSRRTQTTPYDRPLTAARKVVHGNSNGGSGWLSKLVDPAQRLITYSAHRLFASVFRRRLPASEALQQQLPGKEATQGMRDVGLDGGAALPGKIDMVVPVEDASASDNPGNITKTDEFMELEEILRQKTFTRPEIDRLTTLLRSKTNDASNEKEEERNEVIHAKPLVSHERDEKLPHNLENGIQNHLSSTPLVSSSVLDERIASPAELAKAYMGSKPSGISPSVLGLRDQMVREDSVLLHNRTPLPPKSHMMSLLPRSSVQVGSAENGFVTPRFRGRSAVYSMARATCSRSHLALKGPSLSSASQSAWKETVPSGSKPGTQSGQKRRSAVLESDIGSVGSIRRIRQKSNLFSSKSLSVPASESSRTLQSCGGGRASQHALLSKREERPNFADTSKDSANNRIPGSSFNPVPSKSSEMASKILQQLDKLVSAREKSPAKLSPSMLQGPALKSLQNLDSSKFLENFLDSKSTGSPVALFSDARDSSSQKCEKLEENGPRKFLALPDKPTTVMNTVDTTVINEDHVAGTKGSDLPVVNSVEHASPKKRAFRMSAHEDYLEADDDDLAASTSMTEESGKAGALKVENKTNIGEAVKVDRALTFSEAKPAATYVSNGNTFHGTSNGSMDIGKCTEISSAVSPCLTVQPVGAVPESVKKLGEAAPSDHFNTAPAIFSSGGKVPSQKESNDAPALIANQSSSSAAADLLDQKSGASSNIKSEKLSSFALGATDTGSKVPNSDKIVDHSPLGSGFFTSAASSPSGSIFSFGSIATSSTPNKGSLASSPSVFPTAPNLSSSIISAQSPLTSSTQSFAGTGVSGNLSAGTSSNLSSILPSASSPSSTMVSTFKFGVSPAAAPAPAPAPAPVPASASASIVTASTAAPDSKEPSINASTSANLVGVSFGSATSAVPSTAGSIFSGTASAITITPSAIFGGSSSALTSTVNNIFGGTSSTLGSTGNSISSGTSAIVVSTGCSMSGVTPPANTGTGSGVFAGTSAATTEIGISSAASSSALAITGSNIFGCTSTSTGSSLFGGTSASTGSTGSSLFGGTSASTGSSLFGGISASTGSGIFGFSAGVVSASANSQSQASNPFEAANAQTGATSTQNVPFQFGSSASTAPSFGLVGSTSLASSSSPFGPLSTSGSALFSSGPTSQTANSISTGSTSSSTIFGSNWQAPKSTPTFGSSFGSSSSSSSSFFFGGSSGSAPSSGASTPMFGSTATTSASSVFGFGSTPTTSSQSVFGNSAPGFTFGSNNTPQSTNGSNTDQMNMEDSMAEDTYQTKTTPVVPVFGQPHVPPQPQPNFAFGASSVATPPPFQFGSQQNTAAPQNMSPFQASGSLEFNGGGPGGSFSLGSTGGDKSNRRFVKVNRNRRGKK